MHNVCKVLAGNWKKSLGVTKVSCIQTKAGKRAELMILLLVSAFPKA